MGGSIREEALDCLKNYMTENGASKSDLVIIEILISRRAALLMSSSASPTFGARCS